MNAFTRISLLAFAICISTFCLAEALVNEELCTAINGEKRSISCSRGHIIIVKRAFYGRERVGNCVEETMGHIGCSVNALEYYQKKCNGNATCKFLIPDGHLEGRKPCKNNELKNYLDIGYDCVKAIHRNICHGCKRNPYYLEPTGVQTAILSPKKNEETCCPIIFNTKIGFRFELSVVSRAKPCNFRVLEDNWQNEKDVCATSFLSVSHKITVVKDWNVTILYRVIMACPISQLTSFKTYNYGNGSIRLTCNSNSHQTTVHTCFATGWKPSLPNCYKARSTEWEKAFDRDLPVTLSLIAGVLIAFVIPLIVLFIVKKRMEKKVRNTAPPTAYCSHYSHVRTLPLPCKGEDGRIYYDLDIENRPKNCQYEKCTNRDL
ncbi:DgyrCDS12033 [Dimorphilus gyrociliatus]|uniref:DgyrCDS12033 n=1 Tax=Dimorphilus gyrociliatus TaxID=2664684 RepID=A0A7I8W649_9ANNE|nr:DgyrCDS12033 [Dimorphilus gyrociliatus]